MEDIKRILVVSRMTTYCRKALHYGISLSKRYGASLSIIHVVHNPFGLEGWTLPPLEQDYSILLKKSKEDIDAAINAERVKGLEIKEVIREGEPTEVILSVVKEENIDLIIMLAHEEGRMEHFLFGHSNEELIRKMPCSIFLVKKEPAIFGAEY
ncbi:MAG TPA: universal stress protein [Nitrospiraceae bacterium]|nr:universal stress protein [Nitrospiraceae bacterium]